MKYEFYIQFPDNLILVETVNGNTVIRAAKDNFSEARKNAFIRWLAQEGFIADEYQYWNISNEFAGIEWEVEKQWTRTPVELTEKIRKAIYTVVILTTIVWIIIVTFFLFKII